MEQAEFLQEYAGRAGVTVDWLAEKGWEAQVCECSVMLGAGWHMVLTADVAWFSEQMERHTRRRRRFRLRKAKPLPLGNALRW